MRRQYEVSTRHCAKQQAKGDTYIIENEQHHYDDQRIDDISEKPDNE